MFHHSETASADVVVIGAGILGLFTAYHLAILGVGRVHLIERQVPTAGSSGRTGALIRSTYDNEAEARLALASLPVFREWGERIGGSCGFRPTGLLTLVPRQDADGFRALVAAQRSWGVDVALADAAQAMECTPLLRLDEAVGALSHEATAGCCDPILACRALHARAAGMGVTFGFGDGALALQASGDRITGVRTAQGTIAAGAVVVAAGTGAATILGSVGIDLGLVPHGSRVMVFHPWHLPEDAGLPTIIDHVQQAWFRPMPGNGLLVGNEFGGQRGWNGADGDMEVPADLVADYRRVLSNRFDRVDGAALRGAWSGVFVMSPDGRPILGPAPGYANLLLAVGDSGTSFKTAPAIGLALAETLLRGRADSVAIDAFAPRLVPKGDPVAVTVSR
ncbi:NAD(P)/FAD-dependent oxidoreductase [Azospirillum soli]|uniref:NAD(P)/FAD-dependent oxidoreductase n=1 Tax=Azospirillum soli TaxID=1304799 RepID=UPI001AE9325C|nr:FAD-binding oxidoreductase [Azospirillum soli]MBP2314310.1 sarcosine oxidase subunit beta [Azospirillum soli]